MFDNVYLRYETSDQRKECINIVHTLVNYFIENINDEKEFGITAHYVDEGIDTGDIIVQNTYPISDEDTYLSLIHI